MNKLTTLQHTLYPVVCDTNRLVSELVVDNDTCLSGLDLGKFQAYDSFQWVFLLVCKHISYN